MARLDFKLPDIGEGVTEGEIVEWFVRTGDTVAEDDPMVEIMTDKATVTIGAPCEARVERLCFEVGGVAKVGQVILTLDSAAASNVSSAQRSSRPPATAVGDIRDQVPGAGLFQAGSGAGAGSDRCARLRQRIGGLFALLPRLPGVLRIFMRSRLRRRRRGGLPRTWGLIFGGFGLAVMGGG
jgi:pyruvate/2-oxoglutarate dehydrogenase complex dihydrolipoamide acyltransferase (E2) component